MLLRDKNRPAIPTPVTSAMTLTPALIRLPCFMLLGLLAALPQAAFAQAQWRDRTHKYKDMSFETAEAFHVGESQVAGVNDHDNHKFGHARGNP